MTTNNQIWLSFDNIWWSWLSFWLSLDRQNDNQNDNQVTPKIPLKARVGTRENQSTLASIARGAPARSWRRTSRSHALFAVARRGRERGATRLARARCGAMGGLKLTFKLGPKKPPSDGDGGSGATAPAAPARARALPPDPPPGSAASFRRGARTGGGDVAGAAAGARPKVPMALLKAKLERERAAAAGQGSPSTSAPSDGATMRGVPKALAMRGVPRALQAAAAGRPAPGVASGKVEKKVKRPVPAGATTLPGKPSIKSQAREPPGGRSPRLHLPPPSAAAALKGRLRLVGRGRSPEIVRPVASAIAARAQTKRKRPPRARTPMARRSGMGTTDPSHAHAGGVPGRCGARVGARARASNRRLNRRRCSTW